MRIDLWVLIMRVTGVMVASLNIYSASTGWTIGGLGYFSFVVNTVCAAWVMSKLPYWWIKHRVIVRK